MEIKLNKEEIFNVVKYLCQYDNNYIQGYDAIEVVLLDVETIEVGSAYSEDSEGFWEWNKENIDLESFLHIIKGEF